MCQPKRRSRIDPVLFFGRAIPIALKFVWQGFFGLVITFKQGVNPDNFQPKGL